MKPHAKNYQGYTFTAEPFLRVQLVLHTLFKNKRHWNSFCFGCFAASTSEFDEFSDKRKIQVRLLCALHLAYMNHWSFHLTSHRPISTPREKSAVSEGLTVLLTQTLQRKNRAWFITHGLLATFLFLLKIRKYLLPDIWISKKIQQISNRSSVVVSAS